MNDDGYHMPIWIGTRVSMEEILISVLGIKSIRKSDIRLDA